jgi:uncharacterized membrane protein
MTFIWIGSLLSVLGWLFLFFGVGLESSSSILTRALVDVYRVTIASNVIYLGYLLILIGVVLNLQKSLIGSRPRSDSPKPPSEVLKPLSEPKVEISLEERADDGKRTLEQAFERTFNKTATVRPDGSVRIFTEGVAFLDFQDADQAWEYCIDHFYNQPGQPQ